MRWSHLFTAASALTLLRLLTAAAIPFVPPGWLLAVYLFALGTDVADGWWARRTGTASAAGATLDAWTDKALHVNLAWTLVLRDDMPAWWMLPWFVREIVQLPMVFLLAHRWRVGAGSPATSLLGRAAAVSLAAATVAVISGHPSFLLTVLVGVLGLCAGIDYARLHFGFLRSSTAAPLVRAPEAL